MTGQFYARGTVNDRSRDAANPTVSGDRQVNERAGLVGELEQLRRRLVTEHRTRTGAVHHGPQHRFAGRLTGEDGVNPALETLPAPASHAPGDGVGTQSAEQCLLARQDTTLQRSDVAAFRWQFMWHGSSLNLT